MDVLYDLHTHTHLSVCGADNATIKAYVESAKRNSLKLIGISDHMWDKEIPYPESMRFSRSGGGSENVINWYRQQPIEHCREILDEINTTDTEGIRFIFGGEVDYCPGLGSAVTEKNAEGLDFMVVPNSHTHHVMDASNYEPYEKHADFMLRATMEIATAKTAKYVTALAHPFDAVCCTYPVDFIIDKITDSQLIEVFSAAAENKIAAEINAACFMNMKDERGIGNSGLFRVLYMAKKAGCRFTFGSDSHTCDGQDRIKLCSTVAELLKLSDKDVLSIEEIIKK